MAAARFAAFAFALLAIEPAAQQPPQTHLTIQVVDQTEGFVPGARIEINPGSGPAVTVNAQGQAALDLPAGSYALSITARGFMKLIQQIDVQGAAAQTITATLEIDPTPWGPGIGLPEPQPEIPLESPSPVFVPLQPLSILSPLPSQRLKRRW